MQTREQTAYVGRFAPSPTGPLHFGSLVTAVASYLQSKAHNGRWLLRIEDIDPPREQPGASEIIITALARYGFEWHGDLTYQSASQAVHDAALQELVDRELAYPCGCSRRDLAVFKRGPLGAIYPGTCRAGCDSRKTAIRLRTNNEPVGFDDGLQGRQSQLLESESGDFIIRRRDGLIAYHLAVVVDDALQEVTEVVRGIDLMDSTPRQIWLQSQLGYSTPSYIHIPVISNPDGSKLSKLTGAAGIPLDDIEITLTSALSALAQEPPSDLAQSGLQEIWSWAFENWQIEKLGNQQAICLK